MASKPKPPKKRQVAWLDAELAIEIDAVAEELAKKLGFKPSRSQTLLHIVRQSRQGTQK